VVTARHDRMAHHFDGKTWSTVLNGPMFGVGWIRITGTRRTTSG